MHMNARSTRRFRTIACALLSAGILACGGSGPASPDGSTTGASSSGGTSGGGSGGTSNPSPSSASLSVRITDSPFSDAKAVLVTFSSVSVHLADGDSWQTIPFTSGSSRTCDLKKLQGPTDVLGVGSLASGHYTQIRLVVSAASIYFDNASSGGACAGSIAAPAGKNASVTIPSGEVKLNHEFTVSGSAMTMVLDFDGDHSIKATGGGNGNGNGNSSTKYMMTPVIRVASVQ
ncbi:MAG TPA: DUF4382 domain-containing protein [Vicinamibacterales bacterium]|nr:DUF4382 domain-containing protein [Vicinamibacterales bacterium]